MKEELALVIALLKEQGKVVNRANVTTLMSKLFGYYPRMWEGYEEDAFRLLHKIREEIRAL